MTTRFGPLLDATGTTFRLWAPGVASVELQVHGEAPLALEQHEDGFWQRRVEGVGAGALYRFEAGGTVFPDPASRQQADDADGWSVVRGPFGRPPRRRPVRPWHETILCEVHVGAATPEGTFAALTRRLEHFRDAGYTGLELMPVNDFPGRRNWGYDGTLVFAPDTAYGTPEELRALVDRAHTLELCVVLDVVYNHFGSLHNFLPAYAPEFFDEAVSTPWGPGLAFDRPQVRAFFEENVACWLGEYDMDGLRFDAVHEMKSEAHDLLLGDLAKAARAVKPDAALIIENVNNKAHWLTRREDGRPVDFTAQWNDDFHHVLNFVVTGEPRAGYEDESRDAVADLEKALADGFVHDGEVEGPSDGRTRGEPASRLPMEAFIAFGQNHDQIGNRVDGRRIVARVDASRLDFMHFVTLLNPQIPLFFMGEEAHLRTGFPFFFDLPEPVASEKRADRYRQMREMFKQKVAEGELPDPNDPATFMLAKLDWGALAEAAHRKALARFRTLVAQRRALVWPLTASRYRDAWSARQGDGIIVSWAYEAGVLNMALNPTGSAVRMRFRAGGEVASTGHFRRRGEAVLLEPWTAMAWRG